MSVGSVNQNYSNSNSYQVKAAQDKAAKEAKEAQAVKEDSAVQETPAVGNQTDTYVQSAKYTPDLKQVIAMQANLNQKVNSLTQMIQKMLQTQGNYEAVALGDLLGIKNEGTGNLGEIMASLQVDEATRAEAEAAISEDGEWGVEKTAGRILDFAKAISGGDPSKIEMLKNAVEKGFKLAEEAWGGKMPEITQKTYDRVMEGFAQWAEESK